MLGMQQPGGTPLPPSQYTLGMSTGEMGAAPMAYKTQAYPGAQGMLDPGSNVAFNGHQQKRDGDLIQQNLNQNGITASSFGRVAVDTGMKAVASDAASREAEGNRIKDAYVLDIMVAQGGDKALFDAAGMNARAVALGNLQSMGIDNSTIGGKIARNSMA